MVRTYDPNGFRINNRSAEQIADAQAAQHQVALAENQAAGKVVSRQAAPIGLTPEQQAAQQNVSLKTTPAPTGVIDQSALKRLMDSGMSYEQAVQSVEGNRGDVQQAFGQVGTDSGATADPNVLARKQARQQGGTELQERLGQIDRNLFGFSIQDVAAAKQTEILKYQAEQDLLSKKQIREQKRGADSAASSVASANAAESPDGANATDPAAAAVIAMLPPGMEGLAPVIQNLLQTNKDAVDASAGLGETLLGRLNEQGKTTQEKLDGLEANVVGNQKAVQGMLDTILERQEANIEQQERAARERLELEVNRSRRQIAGNMQRSVDSKIAQIALKGRIQSDGAAAELEGVKQHYEGELSELESEAGVRRTELSAKFTGLYSDALDKYYINSIGNLKDANAALERITMQDIQSGEARTNAENAIISDLVKTTTAERKSAAADIYRITKDIQGERNRIRDDARSQEQLGWQRLNWAIDTYGSGNVPSSVLESVRTLMPGVDVDAISKAPTAAERKRLSGGSGGGGGGFSPSQLLPTGEPVPLDKFMAQKAADYQVANGGSVRSVEIPPSQKKAWENEYKALSAESNRLSPASIMHDFKIKASKAGTLGSVAQTKQTTQNVQDAINSGDYQLARSIVDSIGRPPPEKTAARVSNLQNLLGSLNEMTQLVDAIEQNVGPFPTEGPLWSFVNEHIETSPEFQRMMVLKDTNLARYSRSVSGETGASTEGDVNRAVSGLLNANVSPAAMRAGLEEARRQAQVAVTNYLQGMRDSGYAVNDLQNTFDSGSWQTVDDSILPPITSEQQDWLNSL